MAPTLLPGDLLVVVHARPPVPGDVVVGELPDGTVAVKRAVERRTTASGAAGWWLLSDDPDFKTRAVLIKEQRSELVKHHLWVLWTDYFKPPHFEKYPQLHTLVNEATKLAGASGTKGTMDAEAADQLLAKIDEIAEIFWETKKA